jgi:hypothetical protein
MTAHYIRSSLIKFLINSLKLKVKNSEKYFQNMFTVFKTIKNCIKMCKVKVYSVSRFKIEALLNSGIYCKYTYYEMKYGYFVLDINRKL